MSTMTSLIEASQTLASIQSMGLPCRQLESKRVHIDSLTWLNPDVTPGTFVQISQALDQRHCVGLICRVEQFSSSTPQC